MSTSAEAGWRSCSCWLWLLLTLMWTGALVLWREAAAPLSGRTDTDVVVVVVDVVSGQGQPRVS